MENYIDDYEAYMRLKASCPCGCGPHCGHSCMTDDCECTECGCTSCVDELARGSGNVQET